jgi:hypothetical protein
MPNRILYLEVRDHSMVPAEAELHLTVEPEFLDGGTEVRGRFMGPRCRFASTVEVAYHLRRVLVPTARPALTYRAIIPEANLWDLTSPHLYEGRLELWQDGQRCEAVSLRHGLCHVVLTPHGLRVNGRPLALHGRAVQALDEEEALALRGRGCNLLVAPVEEASKNIWDIADRIGFFVLGRVLSAEQAALAASLAGHASCLGWLLEGESPGEQPPGPLIGAAPGTPGEARASFLVAPALPQEGRKPVLLIGAAAAPAESRVLGVVEG